MGHFLCLLPISISLTFKYSVKSYNHSTAVLTLEHNFPERNGHQALVDVNLLLETLKSSDTCLGEWLNVVGYVTLPHPEEKTAAHSTHIQAIMVWSAGAVKLNEYEMGLTERLKCMD
jgi:hypothetical protein